MPGLVNLVAWPYVPFADMIVIAFYFLLCPGEYTGTTDDGAAFLLGGMRLHLGGRRLNLEVAPKRILFQALDKVFRPLGENDNPNRQEPA